MSEALNEIHAYFGKLSTTTTKKVSQWAYGQKLIIHDPELPPVFEAYYSNSRSRGTADPQIGTDGVVDAPHAYFRSGADIYVFLMVHEGQDDGRYNKIVHIPIDPCAEPSDVEPEPHEQSVIDQAIAALNSAVNQCEAYVEHYPTVIDGEWYVWNEETEQFVSTGVPATGNGIAEARLNQDYTLTLVFTDGTSFTTSISIRGAQGEKGDTGAVPNFSIGAVTTLPAGSSASASITGTQEEPVLNLSIPQGQDGAITNLDTTLTQANKAADAEAVGDALDKKADADITPKSVDTDAVNVDLDFIDHNGDVLIRFADGHVQTKEFDSDKTSKSAPTNSNSDMDIVDEAGNALLRLADGGIQTKLFDSRKVKQPIIVTVKKDGSGDFTSLRYAIDSITDANPDTKPYLIEIYPGTYNVFDDFTDEEIATATDDRFVDKDDHSFYGIYLTNGISLRGIGNRDDIVIHGELSADDWSFDLRNYVSTLNLQGTMSLENVTVTAKNIRYCVHDDQIPSDPYTYRYVKSCKFRTSTPTSGYQCKTWGEGSRQGKTTVIEDCDFGTYFLWHSDNQAYSTRPCRLIVRDSIASAASIACRNHHILHQVYLYNVQFSVINFGFTNVSTSDYMMDVTGNWKGSMIKSPNDWNYVSGDIARFNKGSLTLTNGTVVKLREDVHPSAPLLICTAKHSAYGVVVGVDQNWVYVQTNGFINADRFGFTTLVEGDELTIDRDGYLEINGTGDTFAVCNWVSQTYGTFVKVV